MKEQLDQTLKDLDFLQRESSKYKNDANLQRIRTDELESDLKFKLKKIDDFKD